MTDTKHYNYGTEVVEFFKHDDEALRKFIAQREVDYFRSSESLLHPQLGVQVSWSSDQPMGVALKDLTELLLKGYKVVTAYSKPLDFNVQLRKPDSVIDSDLIKIVEQAKADYTEERYVRNVDETKRQIAFTVAREMREAETAAAKATADRLTTIQDNALADLLAAYSKPTKPKSKKVDAVTA
ncbi:hypothetical protein [Pseudomonas sp. C2B4]|uniref:hypothetical protein n=1 Tax=Pseudomonas sp. C2B4 TaxID=2735270 RepID=UPI0015868A54|nr:hypothetical protein [Pseudomonas sp. C2B4]NUU34753.1 hypothetical protein [Pseudomonas sp. C2B4]